MDAREAKNDFPFACGECGLHYKDEAAAKRCEAWCREHHSCNLEITRHSREEQKGAL